MIYETMMSALTNRAFLVFSITLEFESPTSSGATRSTMHIVEFAGCERIAKCSLGETLLKEYQRISQSINAFGNVVYALYSTRSGRKLLIPWRDSKLTRILKDALISDNCVFCLCLNPSSHCYDESMNCLRMVNRLKKARELPSVSAISASKF